jgi:hypothetical protein
MDKKTKQRRGANPFFSKLFDTNKRYDKKTVGGIEIETCVNQNKYYPLEGSAYRATEDGSIECSDGRVSVEYITWDPFPIVEIMDDSTKIGKDTNVIMNNAYPCDTDGELVTCGTHVHMSRIGITKKKYPHFNVLMRYIWLTYYQPYCLARFYRFQNRHKNTYAESSSEKKIYNKYQMFNETHSQRIQPNEDWHFEFRGYGEMLSGWKEDKGAPKEYMRVLMNMWLFSQNYYDRYLVGKYPILLRTGSPPNINRDIDLLNILYDFIRKPVPDSVWSSSGISVKVQDVYPDMVSYKVLEGDSKNRMGLEEFMKTYDYSGKQETYEVKLEAFLSLFEPTHLWYHLKRAAPPRRGTLWTKDTKVIRIVNTYDSYVDYVYKKAYNQPAYEPYDLYTEKTYKFLKTFKFDNESKIEKGDWWFDSEDEDVVQIGSDDSFPENMVGLKDFYETYTYGGPIRKNDLWNFGTAGEAGYEIVRVNDVDEEDLIVMITSLDNSIYKGMWMPLINFLMKGTKLNRPPVRKGDIWCNSSGDKQAIYLCEVNDVGIDQTRIKKDDFLQEYTFYRSVNTKDIADPKEGERWYNGKRFAKVKSQSGSYLINLAIDWREVQMSFTDFLTDFKLLMYMGVKVPILMGDTVKIVKDGDEHDGKIGIIDGFFKGRITVDLEMRDEDFDPYVKPDELKFLGRKESSESGRWDNTGPERDSFQLKLKY